MANRSDRSDGESDNERAHPRCGLSSAPPHLGAGSSSTTITPVRWECGTDSRQCGSGLRVHVAMSAAIAVRAQDAAVSPPASPIQSTCAPPSTYASPAYQRSPQSRLLQASQLKLVYALSPNLPPLLLLCGYFLSDIFTHSLCDSSFRCDNLYNRNRNSLCFGGFSVIQVTYEVYLINSQ
ncbi:hypothetical protein PVAP13_1NG298000 [Panicum virgatum]|uniref:Uncharacterized protein n=1 Tax=Panicum virgatum TaxID=38727 RepID=A0A8T0WQS7_PANVG|nr:hypothetical protein PVAP13_1NG298000 [Panicum virgatum]